MLLFISGSSSNTQDRPLIEEAKAHVVVLLFFGLLLLRSLFRLGGSSCRSRGGGNSGKLAGVSQELLQRLRLLEGDVGGCGNGKEVLHAVDDGVRHGGDGRVADGERNSGNVGHTGHEPGPEVVVGNVQDLGVKDATAVVDLQHNQTVAEGADLQHVEESRLGHSDLVAGLDEVDIIDDLDGSLGNLGGDGERLEEGGILWTHASVLCGDSYVQRGKSSSFSRRLDLVGKK